MYWLLTNKGDQQCRRLADRHYSRQTIGASSFTRPGYNLVLTLENHSAVFVWFRPKWESGIKGTERKDGLRAIECTLFHNKSKILSSLLIIDAVACLLTWEYALNTQWPDGIITAVNELYTRKQRSNKSQPGQCFIHAGWKSLQHNTSNRTSHWLYLPKENYPKSRIPNQFPLANALAM